MSISHLKAFLQGKDPDDCIKVSTILELLSERTSKPTTGMGSAKGEVNRGAKLTADQVRAIRQEAELDKSVGWSKRLAEKYDVWDSTIKKIVRGERWKHIL